MGIRNKEISKGDMVTITRTVVEVKTVKVDNLGTYLIYSEGHGYIANNSEPESNDSCYGKWDVVEVKHARPRIAHLPCQAGDLWLDKDGKEWFIFRVRGTASTLKAMNSLIITPVEQDLDIKIFEDSYAAKLLHRTGDR